MLRNSEGIPREGRNYDDGMDPTCRELCDAMNALPGVSTFESCNGHLDRCYRVWFFCKDPYSLAVLARAVSANYGGWPWRIELQTIDLPHDPQFCFMLEHPVFGTEREMADSTSDLCNRISDWMDDRYKDYLSGKKEL